MGIPVRSFDSQTALHLTTYTFHNSVYERCYAGPPPLLGGHSVTACMEHPQRTILLKINVHEPSPIIHSKQPAINQHPAVRIITSEDPYVSIPPGKLPNLSPSLASQVQAVPVCGFIRRTCCLSSPHARRAGTLRGAQGHLQPSLRCAVDAVFVS